MSSSSRRLTRASMIALFFALAPAASAIGMAEGVEGRASGRGDVLASELISTETLSLNAASLAVAASASAEQDALRRRREAEADAVRDRGIEAEAAQLRPGAYVWKPERSQTGPVDIVVSLAAQRAYVFRGGKLIAVSTVSSGRAGHETPTGSFPILQKKRQHFSNLYNNAPMPNMQRMTWDGVALHAGTISGRAASHGCVRLPLAFSDLLFGVTSIGSTVHVVAGEPPSDAAALDYVGPAVVARDAALALGNLMRQRRHRRT